MESRQFHETPVKPQLRHLSRPREQARRLQLYPLHFARHADERHRGESHRQLIVLELHRREEVRI